MEDRQIKALISLLDDNDKEVGIHINRKIRSLGLSAIPFLKKEQDVNTTQSVQEKIKKLIGTVYFDQFCVRLKNWVQNNSENLSEGFWILTTYLHPELSRKKLISDLEQLYYDAWLSFQTDLNGFDQIKIFNSIFFHKLGFKAVDPPSLPSNFMLNEIIDTKSADTLPLSVVYMLIANKLKIPVYCNLLPNIEPSVMPNMCVLTYKDQKEIFHISLYDNGLIFSNKNLERYIDSITHLKRTDKNRVSSYKMLLDNRGILRMLVFGLSAALQRKTGNPVQKHQMQCVIEILDGKR